MTSKEALERLLKIAYVEPGPTKEKFITYARETEHNKTCSDLYNAIKQDLDLLQGFKDNHHSMEKRNIELTTENEKLKKIIEIIKTKIVVLVALKLSKDLNDYNRMTSFENLTQQEYEILKEYLDD